MEAEVSATEQLETEVIDRVMLRLFEVSDIIEVLGRWDHSLVPGKPNCSKSHATVPQQSRP